MERIVFNAYKHYRQMKPFLIELFEYSYHFNQKLVDVISNNPEKTSEKVIKLFNHILNAHQIWNNRIEPEQTTFGVWEIHTIKECKSIDKTNYDQTLLILDKVDLSEIISYINTSGQIFTNSIKDILFHIINHSTYHRGQIASELRQGGLDPFVTDYIFYKRYK